MRGRSYRYLTAAALGLAVAVWAAIALAAGSGAPPGAAKLVAQAQKPVTKWSFPSAFTPPTGKKVHVIVCGSIGITCVRVGKGAIAAGKTLGWQVTAVDGKLQPDVWNKLIRQAIAAKVDGIILAAVPPPVVPEAVKAAREAGIAIAYILGLPEKAVDATVDAQRAWAGKVTADYVAIDSGGTAQALVLREPTLPELKPYNDAFVAELRKCSGCKVVLEKEFSISTAAHSLPQAIASALRANPSINYVSAPFDAIVPFITAGIAQAGKKGKVKVTGFGADPSGLDAMRSGSEVASVGFPAEWGAWQAIDDIARILAGKPAPKLANMPMRLIVPSSAPKTFGWQGDYNYQSAYKRIWGK